MSNSNPFVTTAPGSPLNYQHLEDINKSLKTIDAALQQTTLATAAGIDVSGQVNQLNNARNQLLQIKNVYFPGQ